MHQAHNPSPLSYKKALLAGAVGNFIEWYEFAVYGFLATVIVENFFRLQGESVMTGLILTYASFAVAFFFRPLGAALFGRLGDRLGRKPTLILVLILMTIATALIGLVPTYAHVGITAPILLTLLRILQGLFAGGEYGGAVALMTEFAPRGKRGLYGAWQSLTVALGLLAGVGVVALLTAVLGQDALRQWGWRIAFFLALPMGAVALWLRLSLAETPVFMRARAASPATVVTPAPGAMSYIIALGIGRLMTWSAAGYTFLVIMPTYLQSALHTQLQTALLNRRYFQRRFCPDHHSRRHVERQNWPAARADDRHLTAASAVFSASANTARPGEHVGDKRAGGPSRRRRGGAAGRSGSGDAGGNVSHPGTLYRAGAGVFAVQRGIFRLCGADDYLAYQADRQS